MSFCFEYGAENVYGCNTEAMIYLKRAGTDEYDSFFVYGRTSSCLPIFYQGSYTDKYSPTHWQHGVIEGPHEFMFNVF